MQVLVCDEREPELGTAADDTCWATLEERLETFLTVCANAKLDGSGYGNRGNTKV